MPAFSCSHRRRSACHRIAPSKAALGWVKRSAVCPLYVLLSRRRRRQKSPSYADIWGRLGFALARRGLRPPSFRLRLLSPWPALRLGPYPARNSAAAPLSTALAIRVSSAPICKLSSAATAAKPNARQMPDNGVVRCWDLLEQR